MWYIMEDTHMLNIHLFGTCCALDFCCILGSYSAQSIHENRQAIALKYIFSKENINDIHFDAFEKSL